MMTDDLPLPTVEELGEIIRTYVVLLAQATFPNDPSRQDEFIQDCEETMEQDVQEIWRQVVQRAIN